MADSPWRASLPHPLQIATCVDCGGQWESRARPKRCRRCASIHSNKARQPPRVTKSCEICCDQFTVKAYRAETARFCSGSCRAKWVSSLPHVQAWNHGPKPYMRGNQLARGRRPANAFAPGHSTWNKGLKGIHLSPESEFRPGCEPRDLAELGEERVRTDQSGYDRVWVKIAHPNIWELRARLVWAALNGPIPDGMVIHHIDRDAMNDDPENLACLTRAEHMNEHREELRSGLRCA